MATVNKRCTPIVALDVKNGAVAMQLVKDLGESCHFYKIGSELFAAEGPAIVQSVVGAGASVFLDLKFHDIPNTVQGAVRSAALLGAKIVTVHASGGKAMMEAAVHGAREAASAKGADLPAEAVSTGVWKQVVESATTEIFAVTVLTSLESATLGTIWGRSVDSVEAEVLRMAQQAMGAGVHGIVCSGQEAPAVKAKFGPLLPMLIPGIRRAGDAAQDQARVVTPREAADAGAKYIVLGRTVTAAESPRATMEAVLADLP
jgi:orotidine-5'-phosphate decarboxylase